MQLVKRNNFFLPELVRTKDMKDYLRLFMKKNYEHFMLNRINFKLIKFISNLNIILLQGKSNIII